jgi:hypothetical protein
MKVHDQSRHHKYPRHNKAVCLLNNRVLPQRCKQASFEEMGEEKKGWDHAPPRLATVN